MGTVASSLDFGDFFGGLTLSASFLGGGGVIWPCGEVVRRRSDRRSGPVAFRLSEVFLLIRLDFKDFIFCGFT